MNISDEDLKKETDYLKKVRDVIQKIIDKSNESIDYSKKDLTTIKKFMWDNLTDYTDEERAIALNEMDNKVSFVNDRIIDLYNYEKAKDNPYFGKIVFNYSDSEGLDSIYIGMKNVSKEDDTYVYDWRAPISSIFYNYELGPASFEAPCGVISGELLSKRQYKIEHGNLIRCFNCEVNIDDDYLQEILSNASNNKMKNIVNTIQKEQNQIIRNDNDKYMIVQGVAGSGKTSVALHRIAYLLYKNINLKSNNVLIFSPNDVFSDYISNVLPELGEENVLTTTLYDFAKAFLKSSKKIESYSSFLERIYSSKMSNDEGNKIRYKLSNECKNDIDSFIDSYENSISFLPGIKINERYYPSAYLRKLFLEKYKKLPLKDRVNSMTEYICLNSGVSVRKNYASIRKNLNAISNINYDYKCLYNDFLEYKGFKSLNEKRINYEDIAGLIYTYFKINGVPAYNYIRHVVIDEAQDYSNFQFEILKMLFKNASFTILGDVFQTINLYYNYGSLEELSHIFTNSSYIELNKTYRSSEEIIDYSNQILGLSNVRAIRNTINIPVNICNVFYKDIPKMLYSDINNMNENGMNKIAIITKSAQDANKIFNELKQYSINDIQLVLTNTESVTSSIIVIPSYLSKGLEFDSVIVCNLDDDKYNDSERNLYYVVCTRAQHKLCIYNEPVKILAKKQKRT